MPDDRADTAVIYRIVRIRVEEWRLQNPGRKNDLVVHWIVIRVHRRRSHAPLRAIGRFADLFQVAVKFEIFRPQGVERVRASIDLEERIIAPFVGVTNLDRHRGQFFQRFLFGRLVHPLQRLDSIAQRFLQVVDQLERARFCFRREIIGNVKFPERFANFGVRGNDNTFPARLDLLGSPQRRLFEVEIFVDEISRKFGRGRVN